MSRPGAADGALQHAPCVLASHSPPTPGRGSVIPARALSALAVLAAALALAGCGGGGGGGFDEDAAREALAARERTWTPAMRKLFILQELERVDERRWRATYAVAGGEPACVDVTRDDAGDRAGPPHEC